MDSAVTVAEYFSVTVGSLFLAWFLYRWVLFNLRSFPPGPIGFPLLGYAGILVEDPERVLVELSKRYGKIFSLYIGPAYTVVITDYEIAKEIVSHSAALSRPEDVFDFIPEKGGFAGVNGAEWQEQRRFCVATMRNLGMGRGPWETLIKEHVTELIEEMSSWNGKPADISKQLLISISSNNTALLIGRRLSKKSEIELVKEAQMLLADHFCPTSLTVLVPWLSKYLVRFRISDYHKRSGVLNEFASMFRAEIEKHVKSKEAGHSEDFIGCYLKEMEKQKASNKRHHYSVDSLVGHLIVLFFGGGDTTVSSMHWLILLMANYPEVQKKVHEEMDEIIGREGEVGWDDRKRLSYTMATILEMERYVTINRIFVPRIASETFECSGYTIPKGSRILVNSWAVMHDQKYWDKPLEFMPERFIRNDGKEPSKSTGFCGFSFGKRNCPGETVALMTIFIYFTSVMKKFQISTPSGGKVDLSDGTHGVVVSPVAQELCFTER